MCSKDQQRSIRAVNGIGLSTKERLEKRQKTAKRTDEELPLDWHSLVLQEMLAEKGG